MKTFFPCRALAAAAVLFACAPAHATRPMVADDAGIVAPGQCQLEAWSLRAGDRTEYWALPACNAGGDWELAAGLGRIGPDGAPGAWQAGMLHAKTVLRPLETNGWGLGFTVADQFRAGDGLRGDLSVDLPLSLSLLDDRVLVHLNGGWLREHASGRGTPLWAAGAEWAASSALSLTLEGYGTGRGGSFVQAGLRYTLVPDRLALDAGAGQRAGPHGAGRYFTFGLTAAWPQRP